MPTFFEREQDMSPDEAGRTGQQDSHGVPPSTVPIAIDRDGGAYGLSTKVPSASSEDWQQVVSLVTAVSEANSAAPCRDANLCGSESDRRHRGEESFADQALSDSAGSRRGRLTSPRSRPVISRRGSPMGRWIL